MAENAKQLCAQMLTDGCSVKHIADYLGVAQSTVYQYARNSGIDMRNRPGTRKSIVANYDDIVRQMIGKGHSYKEIADKLSLNKQTVRWYCVEHGYRSSATTKTKQTISDVEISERVRAIDSEFVYLGGYVNHRSRIRVICRRCGEEIYLRLDTLERNSSCPRCSENARREARAKRVEELEAEREERIRIKRERREQCEYAKAEEKKKREKEKEHECAVCGAITTRPKYCSDKCARRAENKRHEVNRRIKTQMAMVDKNITLEALYKRDHGICYLCGMKTNLEDYIVRENTIICGDWYPSIDHVVPLSKNGKHSWQNVKLAHRKCNSVKSDSAPPPQ